jgi:hypothetical protein
VGEEERVVRFPLSLSRSLWVLCWCGLEDSRPPENGDSFSHNLTEWL